MHIGSIGDITFTVSRQALFTFRDLSRARTVKSAKHDVLQGLPRLQHTGRDLDAVSLTVVLEAMYQGDLTPDEKIKALLDLAERGDEQALVFGTDYWGLWFLGEVKVSHRIFHEGRTMRGTVELSLTEYN
ncbi:phage tail protein [Desulfovibrio sp. OttesenSCG-928-G11]|nr:phage tail protein [Desulfovibrio sp. OttesenSCG-928-G11]